MTIGVPTPVSGVTVGAPRPTARETQVFAAAAAVAAALEKHQDPPVTGSERWAA